MKSIGDSLQSAQEAVYTQLKEEILGGRLRGGQTLRQEEMARRLGVSRLPLREALHRLSAEGLVVLRPRRGYAVASLDKNEIRDIFDIRVILEERAGHCATLSRTDEDVAAVEDLVRRMDRLCRGRRKEIDQWSAVNRQFHARLYECSGRRHLCRTVNMLRDSVEPYIRIVAMETGELGRAQAEHHQIVEAFRRRDAQAVGRLCRDHCAYTAEFLMKAISD